MNKFHEVKAIKFLGNTMVLSVDGKEYTIDIDQISQRLATATDKQRRNYVVSSSGYGLHWPEIDEDLSIDSIIGIEHDIPVFSSRIKREVHSLAGAI